MYPVARIRRGWPVVWVRLDDRFAENPKVLRVSPEARWTHVEALCYAARNETDGFIPEARFPVADAKALAMAGLWDEVDGGYQIHDFLDFNFSAEEIAQRRAARSEAGKMGANKRWGKAKAKASAMASAMAKRCDSDAPPSPSPSPLPVPEPGEVSVSSTTKPRQADARRVDALKRIWNENRGRLPEVRAVNKPRARQMADFMREAGDDEALAASAVAAYAGDRFIREKAFPIDTLIRPSHRAKWLDAGRNGHGNGRMKGDDDLIRRAMAVGATRSYATELLREDREHFRRALSTVEAGARSSLKEAFYGV